MSKIISIQRKYTSASQRLYNLAVECDESYIANGIVVHNCKSYLVPNLKGSTKEVDPDGLQPSKASLEKYITLADLSAGAFALYSIEISKKIAQTSSDAKRLALEVTLIDSNILIQESDQSYKFELINPGMLEEGSLKSFEALEGVHVYFGRIKRP